MFENLAAKLESAFKVLKGHGQITEVNVAETLKEVRRALVDADVHYRIARDFTEKVKEKALGQKVLTAVSPGQLMIKITRDELAALMGSGSAELNLKGSPNVILLAGLQGSGKTTFAGKLAHFLKNKRGKIPLLAACDIYRPAAIEQLRLTGAQVDAGVFLLPESKDPAAIAMAAIEDARLRGMTTVIIDTAGRLHLDEEMMDEIALIKKKAQPHETLFIVDSMTGQDAVNTAKAFHDRLHYDGIVLTKMDGDARGGAALTIRAIVNKPIKFISAGEKPEALDLFHPDRMADRILGMGDVVTLVEKAQEQYDAEQERQIRKKIARDRYDLNDFMEQVRQVKKMGNAKELAGMIPGAAKMLDKVNMDDNTFRNIEVIIQSMTPQERAAPALLNGSRRKRIARGSGTEVEEVNQLLRLFDQLRRMMKMMQKGVNVNAMMRKMMKGGR